MDFSEYCSVTKAEDLKKTSEFKQDIYTQPTNKQVNSQQIDSEQLKQTLSKYQNMSQEDLMTELIKETNRQKQTGQLTQQKMLDLSNKLKPMLDGNQQNKLDEILKMLR